MDRRPIEPGIIRTFRYFAGIAMLYFATMVGWYTSIQPSSGDSAFHIQAYINFGTNLLLLGYLWWDWLRRKLKHLYLPIALLTATVVPTFSNLIYLTKPQEDPYLIITRSWLLFPVLIVPLVLIAWQYRFRVVMAFIFFSTVVEISALLPTVDKINLAMVQVLGAPLLRGFAFGIVGDVIGQLIETQREQREKLLRANVRLNQHANTLEQLATTRERNRLARELHDTLAHTLSGLTVNLEAIKIKLGKEREDITVLLNHALKNTRTGLTETRRALKDLRAKQLEDLGLNLAIRNLANEAASRAGLEIDLNLNELLPELSPDVEQSIYRIAQETLENVIKHANAQHITLKLSKTEKQLSLLITDDGSGITPEVISRSDGFGLKGMRERAEKIGGQLKISKRPDKGTIVQFTMELP
ncbi:MAG: hypothetical protein B6I38_03360 [Anaerolineaceae bacterium 4572_5.1]|nr:MAG: hypothetical protein B6I38_03360 [Anaerolineaceae bacterium 4572_5.1]